MTGETLFKGIAVVVDDEHQNEHTQIWDIIGQIKTNGGHVVSFEDIPTDQQITNMGGAAFFVIDWNLNPTGLQVAGEPAMRVEVPPAARAARTRKLGSFT